MSPGSPVVDPQNRVVGVLSEKDIVGALDHQVGIGHPRGVLDILLASYQPKRKDLLQRSVAALLNGVVRDAMSHPAATVDADASLGEAWRLLGQYSVNRLPVVPERDPGGDPHAPGRPEDFARGSPRAAPASPQPHPSESRPEGRPGVTLSPPMLRPIAQVATDLGLQPGELVPAGAGVLKVPVGLVRSLAGRTPRGHLVLVSAMTPTEHGEGKTVVTIGLAMALERLGHPSVACLRQPSLGPVFGVKGGASGGGRATVEPRPTIDLGLTGDLDAITNAQNLLASLVDHHIYRGLTPEMGPAQVELPRASAIEDRSLRTIMSGLSQPTHGFPRPATFVVSATSEAAAIHALAGDYVDLKERFGRILVGRSPTGAPVRASDIGAAGCTAALLAGALAPNLVQTSEGTAAFVHGIPYANVAHGTCSRLAIEAGRALAEYLRRRGRLLHRAGRGKIRGPRGPRDRPRCGGRGHRCDRARPAVPRRVRVGRTAVGGRRASRPREP